MANNRKRLQGRVISDKMDKTVVVAIEQLKPHRLYHKVLKTTKKVMAHDETNSVPLGAIVRIVESKPLSKNKRWVVETVLQDPGNKVVESVADEQEGQDADQVGIEDVVAEVEADAPVETEGDA
jgi:small subunit ribosomal protein S17